MPTSKEHPEQDPAEGSRETIDRQLKKEEKADPKEGKDQQKGS